jgi:predicted RNase H-like HicB family nuclease
MKVSVVLTQTPDLWLAECEEVDRTGEGKTADEAVASLRQALREYFDVEAVAPPAQPVPETIEMVIVDAPAGAPLKR